jgi:hypothetical protein
VVDGVAHRASAVGMPRPEFTAGPPERRRGGFWATVVVTPRPGAPEVRLVLRARWEDGAVLCATLGTIAVVPSSVPADAACATSIQPPAHADTIAVCMATHQPEPTLLRAQVQSLRDQSDRQWTCLISDDCSDAEHFAGIEAVIAGDPRFRISRSPRRLGFYRNFERALEMVPAAAGLVALCDQDDRWHPDKLATLREALGDADMVYSDQRLVDAEGRLLRDTMWKGRANNHSSLTSILVANTITGASTLMRRGLLERALPFPDTPGFQFHDTWLAVIALAGGEVAYVDRPLYDYVQHAGAVFGDVTHGREPVGAARLRAGAAQLAAGLSGTTSRAAYFHGYLARRAQAQVALHRCGPVLSAGKRRELERFVVLDESPAGLIWLTLRPLRALLGATETLGSEWGLARGLAWKTAAVAAATHPRLAVGPLGDASIPPPAYFSQRRLRRWRRRL